MNVSGDPHQGNVLRNKTSSTHKETSSTHEDVLLPDFFWSSCLKEIIPGGPADSGKVSNTRKVVPNSKSISRMPDSSSDLPESVDFGRIESLKTYQALGSDDQIRRKVVSEFTCQLESKCGHGEAFDQVQVRRYIFKVIERARLNDIFNFKRPYQGLESNPYPSDMAQKLLKDTKTVLFLSHNEVYEVPNFTPEGRSDLFYSQAEIQLFLDEESFRLKKLSDEE